VTETTIERPRAEVAAFATRAENAPRWYANIRSVEWRSELPYWLKDFFEVRG